MQSLSMLRGGAAALLCIAGTALPASAQIVTNGDFESPVLSSGFTTYGVGTPAGFGWSVVSGSIDHIDETFWVGNPGQSVDMSGNGPGAIAQNLGLTTGATYQLTFSLAGNPGAGATIKRMEVFWGGLSQGVFTFDVTGRTSTNMGWTTHQLTLAAPSSTTELRFVSLENSAGGPALDSVSVVQVSGVAAPEPGTLALLGGIGLPVVGLALRRRRGR